MDDTFVLVMAAREYYDRELPIPVDMYIELNKAGICPEQLEEMFADGIETEDIVYNYYEEGWGVTHG